MKTKRIALEALKRALEVMKADGHYTEEWAMIRSREAIAALETDIAQPVEPVAWQIRRIDPEEGPSIWMNCDRREFDIYVGGQHHQARELFAEPPAAAINAELLAALKDCLDYLENEDYSHCGTKLTDRAHTAIAKAAGAQV